MRKAKVAALIFGGVSTCIFGGIFGVYATAPSVKSAAPSHDVKNIYKVQSEELANVAAVTSIKTTADTATSKISTSTFSFDNSLAANTTTTAAKKNTLYMDASFQAAAARPSFIGSEKPEAATEATTIAPTTQAPVQTPTQAPTYFYNYTEPATQPWTEPQTEVYYEPVTDAPAEPVYTEPVAEPSPDYWNTVTPIEPEAPSGNYSISDEEFIILCNAVAHEAGCNWIDVYDKAKVVEVIMNRVNSSLYPNTIEGVLTQPYQFSGSSSYVYRGSYTNYVTDAVIEAVELYFNEPDTFNHGYFGFYGDGYRNYFY